MQSAVVHYHEIALKGRNRPFFVGRLARNIERFTRDLGAVRVRRLPGRILVEVEGEVPWEALAERLSWVYGIANFAASLQVSRDVEEWKEVGLRLLREASPDFFRVSARRADKRFPLTSPQINQAVGGYLWEQTQIPVRLSGSPFELHIEVLDDRALIYREKVKGPGGLPVGVSGRVVVLLSGGIDSPVAAARMMRRGCRTVLVHFHSHPFLDTSSQEKARELAASLARFQGGARLYLVPIGEMQQEIVARAPPPMRVLLYRRQMVRLAERIAGREKALGLCTGESVGQVASQTLENLGVTNEVSTLPILRPLIGMDKEEISDQAKALGTFSISIRPDQDCCTLFTPRQPMIHGTPEMAREAEESYDYRGHVEKALEEMSLEVFRFPRDPG